MLRNGEKLKGFRKQNKMTQKQLGAIVGKSSKTISKYETGVAAIPNAVVSVLNEKYNLKLKASKKIKSGKTSVLVQATTAVEKQYVEVNSFKAKLKQIVEPLLDVLNMLERK